MYRKTQRRSTVPSRRRFSSGINIALVSRFLVFLCALAGALVFLSTPAVAMREHVFSAAFGSEGTGNGQFKEPAGVAVNEVALGHVGDVYVVDKGNNRVEWFNSTGTKLEGEVDGPSATGIGTLTSGSAKITAAAATAGAFSVGEEISATGGGLPAGTTIVKIEAGGVLEVSKSATASELASLTARQEFEKPEGVAVDNDALGGSHGDVYVADVGHNVIDKFGATGEYKGQLTGTCPSAGSCPGSVIPFGELHGLAVDTSGNLWVYEGEEGHVDEFSDTGSFDAPSFNTERGAAPGFTVDPNDNIYLLFGDATLGKYDSTFTQLAASETEAIEEVTALAVNLNPLLSNLFVDKGSEILEYGPSGEPFSAPVETLTTVGFSESHGVAVNGADGTVYATEREAGRVAIFDEIVLPDVSTGSAVSEKATTATLNGAVNPGGELLTSCQFEYGTSTSYGQKAECEPNAKSIPADSSNHTVTANITGLQPDTTYHYRLRASDANGPNAGQDQEFTTPGPGIHGETVTNVALASATLEAEINPNGADTTCQFEYGMSTSYGQKADCEPNADIGSGTTDVSVTAQLNDLKANHTYHFRVVAQNVAGTATGHDHTFVYDTTSGGLPDGRVYEMVTPVDKAGSVVSPAPATVAADGSSMAGSSSGAFAGLSNDELPSEGAAYYRFTRTASGWVTTPLEIPRGFGKSIGVEDSVWSPATAESGADHLSLREADGSVSDVGPVWPPALGPLPDLSREALVVQGAASDAANGIVFNDNERGLSWPFDTTVGAGSGGERSLYEYVGTNNSEPTLVGVSGGAGSTTLIGECGTELGASGEISDGSKYNAVSESGQTVFFTAEAGEEHSPPYTVSTCSEGSATGSAPPADELYARIGGSQTVWVSEPQCTRSAPACHNVSTDHYITEEESKAAGVVFEGASADGLKVFFTTTQQLTNSDTDSTRDLYEYDFNEPVGQRLTQVSGGGTGDATPGAGADVEGVSRISEDGSHVYFVAGGVLTTSPSPGAQGYNERGELVETSAVAQPGADNLYVYDTETKQTAFIADLCSGPEASGSVADAQCPSNLSSTRGLANDQELWSHGAEGSENRGPVQSTPDGGFLVFTSYGDLTSDDTSTARQVFDYDAQTGRLLRISIGQDGFNDNGNAAAGDASIVTPEYDHSVEGWTRGGAIARTMSDDGSYVFFQSPVGLTPQALNDVAIDSEGDFAQNVYEYHEGHVSLISDGKDTSEIPGVSGNTQRSGVLLIGTDASGSDVFFTTADPLVPQDTDTQVDIYDARIGGGFPAPSGSAACQGDTCQGLPSTPPLFGAPSSASFSGAGNLAPPAPSPGGAAKAKPLTRAQQLAKALKACRKDRSKARRAACEKQAKKQYGAKAARAEKSKSEKGRR